MQDLIAQIRARLQRRAYINEAAISHGVVMPILGALGWDTADPQQVVPEHPIPISMGRADFALFGLGHKPAVFIEVKAVGLAIGASDKQLFEYCFHQGVQLCVLTDGREWSFYLPGGQGSYEDRRVYRLQLDGREPEKSQEMLERYLSRARVRDGAAFEDALRDHRDAAHRREAARAMPRAWHELITENNDQLLEAITEKSEALCGYKPAQDEVLAFLRGLRPTEDVVPTSSIAGIARKADQPGPPSRAPSNPSAIAAKAAASDRSVTYTIYGENCSVPNASVALVEILRAIVARDPSRIPELAAAVSGTKINHIGRTPEDINPAKSHLARAAEISPGWSVGLNISNRTKMGIIRTACELYGVRMPGELEVALPNAE